jgi:acyl dehydratase
MPLRRYEDIKLHDKYISRGYKLTESEIIDFGKNWEPAPYHIDPEAAKNSLSQGLIAPLVLLFAILIKLSWEWEPRFATLAGLGVDELRLIAPGRPGDALALECEVISMRTSKSYPNGGIVVFNNTLFNQRGERVLSCRLVGLVEKYPHGHSGVRSAGQG